MTEEQHDGLNEAAQALVSMGQKNATDAKVDLANQYTEFVAGTLSGFWDGDISADQLRSQMQGQSSKQLTAGPSSQQSSAKTPFSDDELDIAWSQMLNRLPAPQSQLVIRATHPNDPDYIKATDDGTPEAVSALQDDITKITNERDTYRRQLQEAEKKPSELEYKLEQAEKDKQKLEKQLQEAEKTKQSPEQPKAADDKSGSTPEQPAKSSSKPTGIVDKLRGAVGGGQR